MRTFDLSPLYRSAIGFDRFASLIETASNSKTANGYPPYNIELLGENEYRITMAVAGFKREELDITHKQNQLLVTGTKPETADKDKQFLYQGIAERGFERRFQLADYVMVTDAKLDDGLLHIELHREIPEALKTKKIDISTTVN